MNKPLQLLSVSLFFSSSAFTMTLCEAPKASGPGSYTNSPTCVAAVETTNQSALKKIGAVYSKQPPYIAALEPVSDQDIQRYIFTDYYRYINFPVGQSFTWYLTDGDPSKSPKIILEPVVVQDKANIKVTIALNTSDHLSELKNNSTFIELSSFDSTYDDFNAFLTAILPIAKIMGFGQTVNWLLQLKNPPALTSNLKMNADGTQGAYLSVRYVQTCSGSLIPGNKIISAAHCYYDSDDSVMEAWDSANSHKVYIIGNNWKKSPYVAIADELNPDSGNIAPGYKTDSNMSTDYAIVSIKPIPGYQDFDNIQPFKLGSKRVTPEYPTAMYHVGFGQTEPFKLFDQGQELPPPTNPALRAQYYQSTSSPIALIGKQTFINKGSTGGQDCSNPSGAHFCAGNTHEPSGGYGDSGGPIFSVDNSGSWILHGHYDYSSSFANNQYPGGFLSSYYLCTNPKLKQWITQLNVSCVDT